MNQLEASFILQKALKPGMRPDVQFPGGQWGGTIEEIKSLIKRQKRMQGFNMVLAVGTNTFTVKLSGSARLFLGFLISFGQATETFSLTVNNEVIMDQVPVTAIMANNRALEGDYISCPRPLSGSDEIKITYNAVGAVNSPIVFYYL